VRREVERVLTQLTSSRLVNELQALWRDATGTASPGEWSVAHGVPVGWLVEDAEWTGLLSAVEEPRSLTVPSLERTISRLGERMNELKALLTAEMAKEALLRVAVGEYRAVVQDEDDMRALRVHLSARAGADVRRWERSRIEEAGRDWVQRAYSGRFYPRAVAAVDQMPEAEIRAQLKQLVRHPAVGLRLIARKA